MKLALPSTGREEGWLSWNPERPQAYTEEGPLQTPQCLAGEGQASPEGMWATCICKVCRQAGEHRGQHKWTLCRHSLRGQDTVS